MPSFFFIHSMWIFLFFSFFSETPLAYSDLFSLSSGSDDLTTTYSLLTPNDQEPNLDEGPLLNIEDPSADWNLFTNSADGNLLSENLLSACSTSDNINNEQTSKVRARDTSCPANLDLPPRLPKIPDISEDLKEADGPNRQFPWLIYDADGVTVGANEPKYYCLPHTPPYSIPVCGSGKLSDRWFGRSPLYPQIDKCSLSESSVCLRTYLSPTKPPSQSLAVNKIKLTK